MSGFFHMRPARLEDLADMQRITKAEFPAVSSIDARIEKMVGGAPWHIIKNDRVRRELEACPEACAVAESEGVVIGYVTNVIEPLAQRGTIANLAVTSACQGRGVGRALLEWALARFRSLGLHQAKIETLETNEAGLHLYPRMGFREVIRQVHFVMPLSPPS